MRPPLRGGAGFAFETWEGYRRLVCAAGLQRYSRPKTEARRHNGQFVFVFKPGQGSEQVSSFRRAVMLSLAPPSTAKVEAQHRPTQPEIRGIHHFHGVVDNLVMQGTAAQGMGMGDH